MYNDKLVEEKGVSEETPGAQSDHRRSTLVVMGPVSVETKGIARGFELGFTPKS